jgi:hypothetical protein
VVLQEDIGIIILHVIVPITVQDIVLTIVQNTVLGIVLITAEDIVVVLVMVMVLVMDMDQQEDMPEVVRQ